MIYIIITEVVTIRVIRLSLFSYSNICAVGVEKKIIVILNFYGKICIMYMHNSGWRKELDRIEAL